MKPPLRIPLTDGLIREWARRFFPHLLPGYGVLCVWAVLARLNDPRKKA